MAGYKVDLRTMDIYPIEFKNANINKTGTGN